MVNYMPIGLLQLAYFFSFLLIFGYYDIILNKAIDEVYNWMYISRIFIRNFRKFGNRGTEFFFRPDINIVIGENNSGKSALFDALRLALSSGLYRKNIYIDISDFHINSFGEQAKQIDIDIFFEGLLDDHSTTFIKLTDGVDLTKAELHVRYLLGKDEKGNSKIRDSYFGYREAQIDREVFDNIKLIYMRALRNAENDLKPAKTSQLARLLDTMTPSMAEKEALIADLKKANDSLKKSLAISAVQEKINSNLSLIEKDELSQNIELTLLTPTFDSVAGSIDACYIIEHNHIKLAKVEWLKILEDYSIQEDVVKSAVKEDSENVIIDYIKLKELYVPMEFLQHVNEKRLRTNQALSQNGLGYNNILSMAALLGDLQKPEKDEFPIFLIEEPEAHLHPQLLDLLFSFYRNANIENKIQVFLSSHSPTLVAKADIDSINVIYQRFDEIESSSIAKCGLSDTEKDDLKRYLDVTKSQMFFAKRVIFVEGISEALLLTEFAKRLDKPLDLFSVEIVNIDGVDFEPFAKLYSSNINRYCLKSPCVIITDDDRCINVSDAYRIKNEELDFVSIDASSVYERLIKGEMSKRAQKLLTFRNDNIEVRMAYKTLEYELSIIPDNHEVILKVLDCIHPQYCASIREKISKGESSNNISIFIWSAIRDCKGIFSQLLARKISKRNEDGKFTERFIIPRYISDSITYISKRKM